VTAKIVDLTKLREEKEMSEYENRRHEIVELSIADMEEILIEGIHQYITDKSNKKIIKRIWREHNGT